jgi:alkylhydroperoxidase/carboxymuconolactone decarboxylase family protein YurZ
LPLEVFMSRISPAVPPYAESVQARLDELTPAGAEPLLLFRVLARDERLFGRLVGAGLLDRGHLSLHEREVVILRVCADHRSEYEWGVHVSVFAVRAGLTREQVAATLSPEVEQACWPPRDRLLLRLCDELAQGTRVSDGLWRELVAAFSDAARLELLLLASFYRTISTLTNTLELALEPGAARFAEARA